MKLFTRFIEIYRVTPEQHTFLKNQIAIIGRSQEAFPLVFQHGDPGTWNVMATPTGQAVFLDWEAAEPQGMPLWDLFYFMRSYAVWAARLGGVRSSLQGFTRQLLTGSELSQLLIQATHRYCQRTDLPHHLIEPLFYTCWMHRALKEATRLVPAKLEKGHYVNLLGLCIEQRDARLFGHLFS
jgi:thiamine kinase-like enzyme